MTGSYYWYLGEKSDTHHNFTGVVEPKIIYLDFEVFNGTGICIETVQHF